MEPTLEEPPKWNLLADILKEIEEEMIRLESLPRNILSGIYISPCDRPRSLMGVVFNQDRHQGVTPFWL
jgi:hypothetical protein